MNKHSFKAFSLFTVIAVSAAVSTNILSSPAHTKTKTNNVCPYKTEDEWQQFLDRAANNQKWVKTCEDSIPCDKQYYAYVKQNIEDTLEKCVDFISQHPTIDRCTKNIRNFTPSWMRQHDDDSYGFLVNNHTYLTEEESPDRPQGMMLVPKAIANALPYRAKVEEAARLNGWKYLTHDSALGGSRTFVVISDPKGRYDTWLLLNLENGAPAIRENTPMSMLAVQKKDAVGKPLSQVRLHFRDYTLEPSANGYKIALYESNNGKCYSCHASGVRQLIARRTPVLDAKPVRGEPDFMESANSNANAEPAAPQDFAYQRLMELNRKLRSYGAPDWEGKIIPENHGPALGKAQGCTDCHDGQTRGILTVSTSQSQLKRKIFTELSMPSDTDLPSLIERDEMKNPELTVEEKAALEKAFSVHEGLAQDFESSRFPSLRDWLLEIPCRG